MDNSQTLEQNALQLVFDNMQTSVYVSDLETYDIIFANKVLKSMFPFDIEGHKCWQLLASQSGPCEFCKKKELRDLPIGTPVIWDRFNSDLQMWLQMNESFIRWPDDRIVHLTNVTDITQIKKREEELGDYRTKMEKLLSEKEESEQIMKSMMDNLANGFLYRLHEFADLRSMKYISAGAAHICGVDCGQVVENPEYLAQFFNDEDKKQLKLNRDRKQSHNQEIRFTKPNGEKIWLRLSESPRTNSILGITVWDGIAMDITSLKDTESALIEAKEQAQDSDRLKSVFLANMSHEIRTPMNAIIGFLNILSTEDTEDELPREMQKEYMRIVRDSANQLLNLIGDILDISKIDAGQMKIIPEKNNIRTMLLDMNSTYLNQMKSMDNKNIELIVEALDSNDNVMHVVDSTRLRQVLGNLIGNAIKFTDKGYVKFGCKMENELMHFFVQDTGIGIKPENIENLGEPFNQVHEMSSAAKYGGTGIGLAISMNLVKLMGGEFKISSELGKGSTFEFTLPDLQDITEY